MINEAPLVTADPRYNHRVYLLKKQFFKMLGSNFRIYDETGQNLLFFVHQKAFKLKEDIRVYGDENKTQEVLTIAARKIIDFSAAYDVRDAQTGQKIGAMKRKGWKSILRDSWIIMDANDQEIGQALEDSGGLAFLRRFIEFAAFLLPQAFHLDVRGTRVAEFKQHFNPFVQKMDLNYSADTQGLLDRRMGIAAAVLILAIEGQQNR